MEFPTSITITFALHSIVNRSKCSVAGNFLLTSDSAFNLATATLHHHSEQSLLRDRIAHIHKHANQNGNSSNHYDSSDKQVI